MLISKDLQTSFAVLFNYLDLLTKGGVFFRNEEYRDGLKEPIEASFSLLKWMELKIWNTSNKTEELFEKYKISYLARDAVLKDSDFEFETKEALNDEINYLNICVKNICDIELDSASDADLVSSPAPNVAYLKNPDSLAVYNGLHVSPASDAEMSIEKTIDDLVIKSHALERLNRDINEGHLYIYKTRPERNVRIKQGLSYLSIVGIIVSLALVIAMIYTGRENVAKELSHGKLFTASVFSVFYFSLFLSQIWRTFRNDNFKYSFQRKTMYLTLLYFLMLIFIISVGNRENSFSGLLQAVSDVVKKALWISLLVIVLVACCVYLVSYFYFQPEKDKKLIEEELAKHVSDLSKANSL